MTAAFTHCWWAAPTWVPGVIRSLAQMAADCLDCELSDISVRGVDTDQSPYDTGSYASSTTYVTGGAVVKTCAALRQIDFGGRGASAGCEG